MADTEKTEVHVKILGDEIRLILPGDGWTYEEAKLAKNVSEGMSPGQIEFSLREGDPDAWLAVLRISYKRAGKDFPSARILGEVAVGEDSIFEQLNEQIEEAMNARPPTKPTENGSAAHVESASTEPVASQSLA